MINKQLNIGFDAKRLFHNYTGLGNYSRTLVQNLAVHYPENNYHLYTPSLKNNKETSVFITSSNFQTHTANHVIKAWWRTRGIIRDLEKHQIDIYHGLSHEIPLGLSSTKIKSVVTVHDLVIKVYPDFFPWIDRQIYDWKFRHACENADKIIAISEHTKQDIIKFYQIPSEKIEVIYQTCQAQFKQILPEKERLKVAEKYQLSGDFLLYVGSINERKNLLSIVQALELLSPELRLPLVVIGSGKSYKKKVETYMADKKIEEWVKFVKIDFQDLPALYQQAKIFIYPSVYEGFGIPIIEALYSQTPVITTQASSLPEAGGDAAHYVNTPNAEEIADGIKKILSDEMLQEQMIKKGNDYIKKFDQELLSVQLMNLYHSL